MVIDDAVSVTNVVEVDGFDQWTDNDKAAVFLSDSYCKRAGLKNLIINNLAIIVIHTTYNIVSCVYDDNSQVINN
jgi:hypothetical protein